MKQFKRLLVLLAIISAKNSTACSSYIGREGYRIGLFLPYTYYKPWLGMFQYDLNTAYDPDISMAIEHDRLLNCKEWKNYCGRSVDLKDIYFVMYEMPPGYFLEMIQKKLDPARTESRNTFIRWILQHRSALSYMRFAKYCESVSIQRMDPWDEDMIEFDTQWQHYYDEAYIEWQNSSDHFLGQRWALQFNRIHVYGAGDHEKVKMAMDAFEKEPQSSDLVRGWNCAYVSMLGDKDKADKNILLAKAFDLTQDKKYFTVRQFSSDALSATIERMHNNPHLRAIVYGLAALNKQEECIELLSKIAQEDANSEILELVLAREIQKTEDRLLTEKIAGFYPASSTEYWVENAHMEKYLVNANAEQKSRILKNASINSMNRIYFSGYAQRLLQLVKSLLDRKHVNNPAFLHLAAAHLSWCTGNTAVMSKHVEAAGKMIRSKDPLYVNFCIEKVLLNSILQKKPGNAGENLAYEVLAYTEKNSGYDVQNLSDQFCMVLSTNYEEAGEFYKSVLIMPQIKGLSRSIPADAYGFWDYTDSPYRYFAGKATLKDADEMSRFFSRKDYNLLEGKLAKGFARDSASYDILMEWVGSVYVRNEKWEQALHTFEKIDPQYWNVYYGDNYQTENPKYKSIDKWYYYPFNLDANPFYAKVTANHSRSVADTVHYNKLSFTRKWMVLQKQAGSKNIKLRDAALLQMADARYNMTWYGNSWIMWRNEWSAYENKYWPGLEQDYFGCERTRKAYQELYDITTNKEVKAHCCVMLALCDRNKAYFRHRSDDKFSYSGSKYLTFFLKHFNETKTYEGLMSSCMGEEYFVYNLKRDARERW